MLAMKEQVSKVSSVSIGAELHGEQRVPACYIDVQMDMGAEVLDLIASGLRGVFYMRPKQAKLIEGSAGTNSGEEADGPRLRFDGLLQPIRLKKEYTGYKARIVWGDLAQSVDVALIDCKVKRFSVDPRTGGSCSLSFQVQAHPDQEGYGQLCMLVQKEIKLTLEPPQSELESTESPK